MQKTESLPEDASVYIKVWKEIKSDVCMNYFLSAVSPLIGF